jgi:nicotinamide riboside kinase
MKKILIFGLARSGTTLLQKHLSRSLRLMSYNEPFGDYKFREQIGDPYQWVADRFEADLGINEEADPVPVEGPAPSPMSA